MGSGADRGPECPQEEQQRCGWDSWGGVFWNSSPGLVKVTLHSSLATAPLPGPWLSERPPWAPPTPGNAPCCSPLSWGGPALPCPAQHHRPAHGVESAWRSAPREPVPCPTQQRPQPCKAGPDPTPPLTLCAGSLVFGLSVALQQAALLGGDGVNETDRRPPSRAPIPGAGVRGNSCK